MPIRKRVYKKRKAAPRRRKLAISRGPNNLAALARTNYARCSEIKALNPGGGLGSVLTTNTVYSVTSALAMTGAFRAKEIAQYYQEFRITKVIFRFKPLFDTYQAGVALAGGAAPQLYMYVNRDGDVSGDSTTMTRMGINPISLAKDGNKTITWKPSVVYPSDTGLASIIKTSPWLNCNNQNTTGGFVPNATLHYGLVFNAVALDGTGSAPVSPVGTAEIETFFEFRRPQYQPIQGDTPVVSL